MIEVTYVAFRRDTNELKIFVRFGFRFMQSSWSCQSTKPRPDVQNADDVVPSNEYALVLW
jgi:hypothetical protein